MGTNCNHVAPACQPHVTFLIGNLLYPQLKSRNMPTSQPMQRLFDIVKAEDWLARTGKNRSDLARALGYERQAVGHWFRGRGEPNVQQMKVMAKELGCHWLELATEETIVVYQDEERARVEKIRALSKEELAELDAFLAFKEKLNV